MLFNFNFPKNSSTSKTSNENKASVIRKLTIYPNTKQRIIKQRTVNRFNCSKLNPFFSIIESHFNQSNISPYRSLTAMNNSFFFLVFLFRKQQEALIAFYYIYSTGSYSVLHLIIKISLQGARVFFHSIFLFSNNKKKVFYFASPHFSWEEEEKHCKKHEIK